MEEEYEAIKILVSKMTPHAILSYGEVYAFFREELNNEMIDVIEAENKPSLIKFMQSITCKFKNMSEFVAKFVWPLGKYIEEHSEFKFINVYGPAGLNSNFSLEFLNPNQNTFYFSFHPSDYNNGEISVWKESTEPPIYKSGTIGYMNQGNLDSEIIFPYTSIETLIEKYFKDEN